MQPISLQVSSEEVVGVIKTFPCGSGGPDGCRPQGLMDVVSGSAVSHAPRLLRALTALINLVLEGKTTPSACPFFFGASLVALQKTCGV